MCFTFLLHPLSTIPGLYDMSVSNVRFRLIGNLPRLKCTLRNGGTVVYRLKVRDAWSEINLPVASMNSTSSLLMVSLYSEMFLLSLDPRSSCMSRWHKPSFCPRFLAKMLCVSSWSGHWRRKCSVSSTWPHLQRLLSACPNLDMYWLRTMKPVYTCQ